ncbi:unnamed protein product [Cyprideis torosa]|uniref:Nonsense-mediated mRNA decay factor SMG8 n=1 Tax=Cyprideis torosa TaxID=163714 RepID=A0A7R8ZK75_9CRUS|nr:unnamed protein product [Cyprideis torosa]CAG0881158.1 unnamed protein product [Cyprideis torosa]
MFSPKEENIWKKLSSSSTKTKVVVVGFLGGSSSFSRDLNLNALFGREASSFARLPVSVLIQLIGRSQLTSCNKEFHELEREVECYYDEGESVVYVCTSETSLEAASRDQPDLSPLAAWESLELRKKLLLFIICHIIVWIQPNSSFDLSCLETLRVLEKARHRFQSSVISLLRGTSGVSDAWCKYGRFCCPRVIFYFPNLDLSYDLEAIGKQKLQNAMEDKIYRVLRRDRHITNIAMNSLFALPADKHFVALPSTYLPPPPVDFMEYILERCHESVQSAVGFTSSSNGMPHPYDCQLTEFTPKIQFYLEGFLLQVLRRDRHITNIAMNSLFALPADKHFVALPSTYLPPPPVDFMEYILERCHESVQSAVGFTSSSNGMPHPYDCQLTEFTPKNCGSTTPFELVPLLFEEMETARTTGFDDNFGRTPVTATFEALATLQASCEVAKNFSEKKCRKAVPLAKAAYAESLPASYGRDHHERRMGLAAKVFYTHARGPSLPAYWNRLMEQCEAIWNDGHRLCEAKSLRGHECTEPRHRTTAEATQDKQAGVAKETSTLSGEEKVGLGATSDEMKQPKQRPGGISKEQPITIASEESTPLPEKKATPTQLAAGEGKGGRGAESRAEEAPEEEEEDERVHLRLMTDAKAGLSQPEGAIPSQLGTNAEVGPKEADGVRSREEEDEGEDETQQQTETPPDVFDENKAEGKPTGGSTPLEDAPPMPLRTKRLISRTEYLSGMLHSRTPEGVAVKHADIWEGAGLSQPEGAIPSQLGTNAEVGPKEADGVRSREEEDEGEDETQQQTETPPDVFDENKAEGKPTGGSTPLEDAPPMPLRTKRLISRTEYLSGMLHSRTPEGVLPRFQHWSLLKMGPPNHFVSA